MGIGFGTTSYEYTAQEHAISIAYNLFLYNVQSPKEYRDIVLHIWKYVCNNHECKEVK